MTRKKSRSPRKRRPYRAAAAYVSPGKKRRVLGDHPQLPPNAVVDSIYVVYITQVPCSSEYVRDQYSPIVMLDKQPSEQSLKITTKYDMDTKQVLHKPEGEWNIFKGIFINAVANDGRTYTILHTRHLTKPNSEQTETFPQRINNSIIEFSFTHPENIPPETQGVQILEYELKIKPLPPRKLNYALDSAGPSDGSHLTIGEAFDWYERLNRDD